MRKAGRTWLFKELLFLRFYGGMEMGFINTVLVCDYISGATGRFQLLLSAYWNWNHANYFIRNGRTKTKICSKISFRRMVWCLLFNRTRSWIRCQFRKNKSSSFEDGTHYKITGQKMWISNAGFCNVLIVLLELKMIKTSQVLSLKMIHQTEFFRRQKNTN